VVDETEIDRLLLRDEITASEHSTLEKLLSKLSRANMGTIRSPVYEAPVSDDPSAVGDRRANQMRSIVGLIKSLDQKLGIGKRKALVNLVLADAPWPGNKNSLKDAIYHLSGMMR